MSEEVQTGSVNSNIYLYYAANECRKNKKNLINNDYEVDEIEDVLILQTFVYHCVLS